MRIEDLRHGADDIRFGSKAATLIDSEPQEVAPGAGSENWASPRKNAPLARKCLPNALGSPVFHRYLPCSVTRRALAQVASSISEHEMNKNTAAFARAAVLDGSAPFSAYFADQEPIDGKITVVDLTDGACRWPTGNPRDLKTFRYCGESARGPYCERHAQLAYLPRAA